MTHGPTEWEEEELCNREVISAQLAKLKLTAGPARPRPRRSTRFRFLVTGVTAGVRGPVAGATVRFADRRARTDARGQPSDGGPSGSNRDLAVQPRVRATIVASIRRARQVRALAFIGTLRARRTSRVVGADQPASSAAASHSHAGTVAGRSGQPLMTASSCQ